MANDADWVETDFQQTAPDVDDPTCPGTADTVGQTHWVALHNAGFLGTTNVRTVFPHDAAHPENASKYVNGVPLVERFTLCEVKKLDAGSWKGAQFANYRVPTLEETLDLVTTSTNRAAKLMVEPKLGTPAEAVALYDAIKAYDDAHAADPGYQPFVTATPANQSRALFNTFNINVARQLADQRPDAQIATVADSVSPVDETDPALFPAGVGIFINNALVTRARVDALHAAGKLAIVWTVNSESRWLELASLGVDILVTDKSKQARAALTGTD